MTNANNTAATTPGAANASQQPGSGQPGASAAASAPDMNQLFSARRDEEMARRDRSLAEFLVMLDGYKPLVSSHAHTIVIVVSDTLQIPEEVTEYYLQRAGFECSDPRL